MRNINRIDEFCKKLAEYWKEEPDWRFGQLMMNVLGSCERDPWFYEEDEMLEVFEKYFKKLDPFRELGKENKNVK